MARFLHIFRTHSGQVGENHDAKTARRLPAKPAPVPAQKFRVVPMLKTALHSFAATLATVIVTGAAVAAPVTVSSTGARTGVEIYGLSGGSPASVNYLPDQTFPASTTLNAFGPDSGNASATFDFQNSGNTTRFDMNFTLFTSGDASTIARIDSIVFTATENGTYALSGLYEQFGTSNSTFAVGLFDLTASTLLFEQQESDGNTSNRTITLGTDPGPSDGFDSLLGNLTGSTIAGHDYLLFALASVGPATAIGNVSLVITGESTEMPAPGAVAFIALGLAGIVLTRRRRKTAGTSR